MKRLPTASANQTKDTEQTRKAKVASQLSSLLKGFDAELGLFASGALRLRLMRDALDLTNKPATRAEAARVRLRLMFLFCDLLTIPELIQALSLHAVRDRQRLHAAMLAVEDPEQIEALAALFPSPDELDRSVRLILDSLAGALPALEQPSALEALVLGLNQPKK